MKTSNRNPSRYVVSSITANASSTLRIWNMYTAEACTVWGGREGGMGWENDECNGDGVNC